jgi:hypothetical protein
MTSFSQALKVDAAGMAAGLIYVDGVEPARLKEQGWLLDQCQRHRWRNVLTSVDWLKSVRDSQLTCNVLTERLRSSRLCMAEGFPVRTPCEARISR